jgi:hypothetical protein
VAHEIADEILQALQRAKDASHEWAIFEPKVKYASSLPNTALIPVVPTIPTEMQQEKTSSILSEEQKMFVLLLRGGSVEDVQQNAFFQCCK